MGLVDQTPMDWVDGVSTLDDVTLNTEVRNAYNLLLNPPICQVHASSPNSIAAGTYMTTWTAISWDATAVIDTEASGGTPMFSSANPTRITVQTPGWYECIGTVSFNIGASNIWTTAFRVNGTAYYAGSSTGFVGTSNQGANPTNLISFNAGDYLELVVTHDSTSAQSQVVSGFIPSLFVVRRRGL